MVDKVRCCATAVMGEIEEGLKRREGFSWTRGVKFRRGRCRNRSRSSSRWALEDAWERRAVVGEAWDF